jgi:RNA polymerase sigma-70 factor (ECF subfamily)
VAATVTNRVQVRYTCDGRKTMQAPASHARAAQDLFREHGRAVYRFAKVLLGRHDDAEDVVQETFLKLLRHLSAGGSISNTRGWLFTVAAHASRDRQRAGRRWIPWRPEHDTEVAPAALPDEDGRLTVIREGLRSLGDRDRLLLALRAQDLSYREIAAAARIRPVSVGRLLARAIERWQRACNRAAPRDRSRDASAVKPERHGLI